MKPVDGPSLLLALSGTGEIKCGNDDKQSITKGTILFVGIGEKLLFRNVTEDMLIFQAYCEVTD